MRVTRVPILTRLELFSRISPVGKDEALFVSQSIPLDEIIIPKSQLLILAWRVGVVNQNNSICVRQDRFPPRLVSNNDGQNVQ